MCSLLSCVSTSIEGYFFVAYSGVLEAYRRGKLLQVRPLLQRASTTMKSCVVLLFSQKWCHHCSQTAYVASFQTTHTHTFCVFRISGGFGASVEIMLQLYIFFFYWNLVNCHIRPYLIEVHVLLVPLHLISSHLGLFQIWSRHFSHCMVDLTTMIVIAEGGHFKSDCPACQMLRHTHYLVKFY